MQNHQSDSSGTLTPVLIVGVLLVYFLAVLLVTETPLLR